MFGRLANRVAAQFTREAPKHARSFTTIVAKDQPKQKAVQVRNELNRHGLAGGEILQADANGNLRKIADAESDATLQEVDVYFGHGNSGKAHLGGRRGGQHNLCLGCQPFEG